MEAGGRASMSFDIGEVSFSETQKEILKADSNYDPDERINIKSEIFENKNHETGVSKEKELQTAELKDYKNDVQSNPELTNQEKERYIKQINEIIEGIETGIENFSTKEKGNFGEMCTDIDMIKQDYIRISEDSVTDLFQSGKQGIDGVYENKDGDPRYVITDAKYGSSQLKETQDGKQLSFTWIDRRLDDAVGKEKADEIRLAQIFDENNVDIKIAHVDENGNVTYEKVDRNGNVI